MHPCVTGWDGIASELRRAIAIGRVDKLILAVECYPGVDELAVLHELKLRLDPKLTIHAADACHPPEKINQLVAPFLAGKDPVPGRRFGLSLVNLFNAEPLWRFRRTIDELKEGLILIVGCGASLIAWGHILVYADLARREARRRFLGNEIGNFAVDNKAMPANLKSRRAFLVDWPVADQWKRPLIKRWDYVLDINDPAEPKLADALDVRSGLRQIVTRPFRLVPAREPAPAEGWQSPETGGADDGVQSAGLDCAPEEDSLVLGFGDTRLELPAWDLVLYQPRALLGEAVHLRFGDAFPFRFDGLDTSWMQRNSVKPAEALRSGDGWREERIGLPGRHAIEIRRHWFTGNVSHHTNGGVNVVCLVAGREAIVESPANAFAPLVVRYAETFIVPAVVGEFTIRPHGPAGGKECATVKAFVRT